MTELEFLQKIKEKENLDNLINSVWEAKNKGVEANV